MLQENNIIPAHVTSKGQITLPRKIRQSLGIHSGDMVGFVLKKDQKAAVIKRLVVSEPEEFNEDEWEKLEKLAGKKGKTFKDPKSFLKSIEKM